MANNRLPYGLCKKYGIELPDGATPKDAWEALKKNGIEYIEDEKPITIKLPDIDIPRSVGAKWRNESVFDFATGEVYRFAEGSKLQNVEVFCGYGTKTVYNSAYKYSDKFGGLPQEWQHAKAIAELVTSKGERKAEVHWSQHEKYGKKDFFVKKWIE